jgi:hypothetical protein
MFSMYLGLPIGKALGDFKKNKNSLGPSSQAW